MTRWVVVGGGAAGCVIAGRLSADPTNHVTLIEAGPDHGTAASSDHLGPYLDDDARIRSYDVRRRPGRAVEPYLLGSGLGGSSLINGSVVVPSGVGADGVGHAIPLEERSEPGPLARALLDADDRAEPMLHTHRNRRRVTTADAYVRPHLGHDHLTVAAGAEVDRVLIDRRRAVGVVTADGREFAADRVVLAAGAIATPALLLRSGVDIEGVGRHLQDHPAFAITIGIDPDVRNDDVHAITAAVTAADHQIIALERTAPGSAYGALIVGLTRTSGRGSVTIDSARRPIVDLHQLVTETDRSRLVDAVRGALDLVDHPSIRSIATSVAIDEHGTPPAAIAGDPAAIERWLLDHPAGFHHVAGTCRRGLVTDDDGWVRGCDRLAIADASLFVEAPPVNIYLATVLQAEQLARRWLGNP